MSTKPIFNQVGRSDGCYDFLHPREVQASIRFYLRPDAPEMKWKSVTISPEYADELNMKESALEIARQLLGIMEKRYSICTSKSIVKDIIAYLETVEEQDTMDSWRCELIEIDEQLERLQRRRDQVAGFISRNEAEKFAENVTDTIKQIVEG